MASYSTGRGLSYNEVSNVMVRYFRVALTNADDPQRKLKLSYN